MKYLIITVGFVFLLNFVSCKNEKPTGPQELTELEVLQKEFISKIDASLISVSIDGAKEFLISGESGKKYSLIMDASQSEKFGNPRNINISIDKASVKNSSADRRNVVKQKIENSSLKTSEHKHRSPIAKIQIDQINGKAIKDSIAKLELTPWDIPIDSIPQYHEKWHITRINDFTVPTDPATRLHLWEIMHGGLSFSPGAIEVEHAVFRDELNDFLVFTIDSLTNYNQNNRPDEPDVEIAFYFHWATVGCAESYCNMPISPDRTSVDGQTNRAIVFHDIRGNCLFGSAASLVHEHMHNLGTHHDCFHGHDDNIQN